MSVVISSHGQTALSRLGPEFTRRRFHELPATQPPGRYASQFPLQPRSTASPYSRVLPLLPVLMAADYWLANGLGI